MRNTPAPAPVTASPRSALVLIGLIVTGARGGPVGINWVWTTLAALGTLSGIALGAGGAGALARPHVNHIGRRAASAALFALLGVGLSAIVLVVTPDAKDSILAMLGALITATSVLGFVVPRGNRHRMVALANAE